MSALHTEQLEYLLSHLAQRASAANPVDCLGVFPANCIPSMHTAQRRLRDACFVVNTDTHSNPGQHWLAFYYDCTKRTLEYFDSYGLNLKMYRNVYSTLASRNLLVAPVNREGFLQDVGSSACGFYCVLYLHCRIRLDSSSAIRKLARLGDSTHKRDPAVVNAVHKLLHRMRCMALPCVFTRQSQTSCPYNVNT
jgi:Adenovirus endoprotease